MSDIIGAIGKVIAGRFRRSTAAASEPRVYDFADVIRSPNTAKISEKSLRDDRAERVDLVNLRAALYPEEVA